MFIEALNPSIDACGISTDSRYLISCFNRQMANLTSVKHGTISFPIQAFSSDCCVMYVVLSICIFVLTLMSLLIDLLFFLICSLCVLLCFLFFVCWYHAHDLSSIWFYILIVSNFMHICCGVDSAFSRLYCFCFLS